MAKELFIPKGSAFLLDKKVENVSGTPFFSMKKWLKKALALFNVTTVDTCCAPDDPEDYYTSVRVHLTHDTPVIQYYNRIDKEWVNVS